MEKNELKEIIEDLDLKSSVKSQGKYVTQIIHFKGCVKRTYNGIKTDSIKQCEFTKFNCKNGAMVLVIDENVLMIEVFPEDE